MTSNQNENDGKIDDEINKEKISSSDDIKWTEDDDVILKEWVDKSACFKWLHEKSYKKYKKSVYFI